MTVTGETGRRRVVIAGGGVAALEAALALRDLAADLTAVELIAPERDFVYRPLVVAEAFCPESIRRFDLADLARRAGTGLRADAITGVDPERRRIRTRRGEEVDYDVLILACGARMREAVPGALTVWGTGDSGPIRRLLRALAHGAAGKVVFCVPAPCGWPCPLYELALMTAAHVAAEGGPHPQLTITTPESSPLELFGAEASAVARRMLYERGIGFLSGCHPAEVNGVGLRLIPGADLAADRVVTVPRLEGPVLDGIPGDEDGFIRTDGFGRVEGLEGADVYAAGDITAFPVKQGGIAAQQADAVAELIAAEAGAPLDPRPFEPVLRGLLLTGPEPRFPDAENGGGRGETSVAASQPLWWPPGNLAGRYLAPFLAELGSLDLEALSAEALEVEIELGALRQMGYASRA